MLAEIFHFLVVFNVGGIRGDLSYKYVPNMKETLIVKK